MIKTYKLLTGKYDQQVALTLPKHVTGEYFTRGNNYGRPLSETNPARKLKFGTLAGICRYYCYV